MRNFKRPQPLSKPVEAADRIGDCANESDLVIYTMASRPSDGSRSPLQELKGTRRDNGACHFYKILYTKRNANKVRDAGGSSCTCQGKLNGNLLLDCDRLSKVVDLWGAPVSRITLQQT